MQHTKRLITLALAMLLAASLFLLPACNQPEPPALELQSLVWPVSVPLPTAEDFFVAIPEGYTVSLAEKYNFSALGTYPILDIALELSSMGVRVDEETLLRQLAERGCPERAELAFHKALLAGELPYTIGGGIGQSRLCMFFLRKAHVGEVQSSIWPEETVKACRENGIQLL